MRDAIFSQAEHLVEVNKISTPQSIQYFLSLRLLRKGKL